jgi:small subunit ribosomal protein S27e
MSFIKVRCSDCSNEQVIFSRAATKVNCLVCGTNLATPTGGAAVLHSELVETLS